MFKRLIGVLPVRDGRVVKSYGYRMWRPAGSLRTALSNLDRWEADEILVLDISGNVGVDSRVVSALRAASVSTPITYGGGLRSVDDARVALRAGADRILLERLLWSNPSEVSRIADEVGRQAIVASLPVSGASAGRFLVSHSRNAEGCDFSKSLQDWLDVISGLPIEELLVIDVDAEGARGKFSMDLAEHVAPAAAVIRKPVIWFGGIDLDSARALIGMEQTVGVAFANVLLERELALREVRDALSTNGNTPIRRLEERHE